MKKTILIAVLSVPVLLGLTGCAAIQKATCNTDAAYSQGINDAQQDKSMDSNYASICPSNNAALNAAYRRGYKFGLKNRPTEININTDGRRHRHHHHRYYN